MSFVRNILQFSKATGRIKEAISALPVATKEDDIEEAAAFKEETEEVNADAPVKEEGCVEEEADPFGLDALISNGKKEASSNSRKEDDEKGRFLKLQRQALLLCLESAAKRYKTPW